MKFYLKEIDDRTLKNILHFVYILALLNSDIINIFIFIGLIHAMRRNAVQNNVLSSQSYDLFAHKRKKKDYSFDTCYP